ncbi:MAG: fibrillarin-like rRNA/tRNA 2'-O-methyltransferase [bacterium]|nr:fibrillarin-like rRNA/tRNA 2'-O-methyltransferase [bacterium]
MKQKFDGVFEEKLGKRTALLTKNSTPGLKFFEEILVNKESTEYRVWDVKKSKLAAAIVKGLSVMPIRQDSTVLYLGAAHGYTVSYISDIANKGFIFALDFAPRVVRDLIFVAEKRENIAPIMADAKMPESYSKNVMQADIIYQDIAQRDQTGIFLKNADLFLKKGGFGILAVKSRSIDVSQRPRDVYQTVRKELEKTMKVVDYRILDPFQKDHALFVCKKS